MFGRVNDSKRSFRQFAIVLAAGAAVVALTSLVNAAPGLKTAGDVADARFTDPEMFIADEFIAVMTRDARARIQVTRDQNNRPATNLVSLQAVITSARAMEFERQFATAKPYPVGHKYPDLTGHYIVKIESGTDLKTAMDAFRADPNVEHVEKIGVHKVNAVPNDTNYGSQYNMRTPWGVNAVGAWDVQNGEPDVIIAVLDTGVRYFHPDLGGDNAAWTPANPQTNGNIFVHPGEIPANSIDDDGNGRVDDTIGYDWLANSNVGGCTCNDADCNTIDNDPSDFNGHGTHCSGIAAAITNNARGVAGVAGGFGTGATSSPGDGASIMPLRIGWSSTCGGLISMAAAASAMNYVATMVDDGYNITAVNCSWSSSNTGGFGAALSAALARDVMVVHAAGNGGTSAADYLGSVAAVVNVAGTTSTGTAYSSTNFGPWVDIAAPGVNVFSTFGASYAALTGTSMSAPHVCGVAALLESCRPDLTMQEKIDIMKQTAIPYNSGLDLGDGIVNAFNAMAECLQGNKYTQSPDNAGEDVASNIDWSDSSPNSVLADDFISDGRPLTTVRWWGTKKTAFPPFDVDDGGGEDAVGVNEGPGGPGNTFGWANRFTNSSGGPLTISTIEVAFGFGAGASGVNIGDAVDGVIWLDAAATGNFINAVPVVRWSIPGGVHANDGVTFATHTVPGSVVVPAGADFYVGLGDIQTQNDSLVRFPASIDESPPSAVRSWAFFPADNTFTEILAGQTVGTIDSFGIPGNWLIRAGGDPAPVPDGWFVSFHEPLVVSGSASEALGVYYCDESIVAVEGTGLGACSGYPTFSYQADLGNCCLVQANVDSRNGETPAQAGAFNDTQCLTYAMDIQAVIGTEFVDNGGTCDEVSTGRSADGDFWGWNTTNTGLGTSNGLQAALDSELTVSGSDWLYGPWALTNTACSEPNMAYALVTTELVAGDLDEDGNGMPDACEAPAPATVGDDTCQTASDTGIPCSTDADCTSPAVCGNKSRYITVRPTNPAVAGGTTSIQVEIVSMPQFLARQGQIWWAGAEHSVANSPNAALRGAPLSCQATPTNAQVWTNGPLHLYGSVIIPGSTYNVRMCDAAGSACSAPILVATSKWGDAVRPFGGGSQPNFGDVSSVVAKFSNVASAPDKPRVDLVGAGNPGAPNAANQVADFADISADVAAFVNSANPFAYPYTVPNCP